MSDHTDPAVHSLDEPSLDRAKLGPYKILLKRRIDTPSEHYFVPDKPIEFERSPGVKQKAVVLRLAPGSALLGSLMEAWSQGRAVKVWFGSPWTNRTEIEGKGATLLQVEVIWSPGL